MKGVLTMTSREIAELTGKAHKDVLRDIRRMFEDLEERGDEGAEDRRKFALVSYRDEKSREYPEYRLGHDDTMTLVAGYDVMLRRQIVVRWRELEATLRNTEERARFTVPAPTPLPDFGPILAKKALPSSDQSPWRAPG